MTTVSAPIYFTAGTISVTTSSYGSSSYISNLIISACEGSSFPTNGTKFYVVETYANNSRPSSVSFTITAPSNFEVSKSQSTGYASTLSITATPSQQSGNSTKLQSTVYVRVKSSATGTPTGTITISSGDNPAVTNLNLTSEKISLPTATANLTDVYFSGSSVTISVTITSSYSGSTNSVQWYNSQTATQNSLANSSSYRISSLTSTTTYYARITSKYNNTSCDATPRVAIIVHTGAQLNTSTSSLTNFTNCQGTASSDKSFTVDGTGVSSNITITAPTGYEVTTTSGSGYSGTITLTTSNQILLSTTIYARLTSSATGTPSGTITINAGGTLSKTITVSGTVSAIPISPITYGNIRYGSGSITLSATVSSGATADWYDVLTSGTGTLLQSASLTYSPTVTQTTNFYVVARTTASNCLSVSRTIVTATVGSQITVSSNALDAFTTCTNIASSSKSFTVSGAGIVGTITLTAPSNFEISKTSSTSGYASTLFLTASSNTVPTTTIYARLTSAATGTTTGNITLMSSGASTQNISVSGTVNVLPIATAITGTGNGTQRINIGVTVSPTGTADWYTSSTTTSIITGATGTLSYTTPYLTTTTQYWALARNASTGCVATSRTNVEATVSAIITPSTTSLSGFNTCYGSSSESQKFTVSASALPGSLTVLPSIGYEVSYSNNSNFTSSITIAPSSYAQIEGKQIYVRLTGTISGTITGTVTLSASGTSKTISLTGVVSQPTVAGTISYTIDRYGFATLTLIGYKGDDFRWEESDHKRGRNDDLEKEDHYREDDSDDDDEKKHNENFHEHEDGHENEKRVENTDNITRTITKSNAYRVTVKNGYCKAEITPTKVATYRATPYPPIGYDNAITSSGTVTISATVDDGQTVDWYSASTGGTALLSGSLTYTTVTLTTTTIYYAESRVSSTNVTSTTRTAVSAVIGNPFGVSISGNQSDYVYVKLTATGSSVSPTTYYWTGGTMPNSATNKFYNSGTYTVYATANGETVSKTVVVTIYVTGVTRYGQITENSTQLVSENGQINSGLPVNYEGKKAIKQTDVSIETTTATNITVSSTTSGGTINSGSGITAKGVVWSTNPWPTTTTNGGLTNDGTGTGTFTSFITVLNGGTLYYVRAYATNSNGTFYGPQITFTTP